MSQHDNRERMNDAIVVEDLTVEESAQNDVKGGG